MEALKTIGSFHGAHSGSSKESRLTSDLMKAACKMEASFLAEMFKHSGLGKTSETFGGGIGEEQFSSFLRELHAQEVAANGGIGLAECIFESLKEATNAS